MAPVAPGAFRIIGQLTLAGLAALLIAVGALNWPSADDFCNRALVETLGFGGAFHWMYFEWSGRVITGLTVFAMSALVDIPALRIVSMLLAAGLVLVAWQISAFVLPRGDAARWPLAAFVLAALTVGLYPLLGQAVFWPTGGVVYLLPLILLLYWLLALRALMRHGDQGRGNVYWFLVSVALGNAMELVLPIVACYFGMMALRPWRTFEPAVRRAVLHRVAGVALGAAVLIGAPGNFHRGSATAGSYRLDPVYLGERYAIMLRTVAEAGGALLAIAAGLVACALVAWVAGYRQRHPVDQPSRTFMRDETVALLMGAALSMVPVLAAPLQFAPRNGLYALVCVLLAALLPAAQWSKRRDGARIAPALFALLAVVGTGVAASRLLPDLRASEARLPPQLARHQLLRDAAAAGRRDVTVARIAAPAPAITHAVDITTDPAHLVNWCVATSYHLDTVTLEGAPQP